MNNIFAHFAVKNFQSSGIRKYAGSLGDERGLGLIELIVSVLIMAGLVTAVLAAYSNLPIGSSHNSTLATLQQDASLAMEEIAQAIRETASATLNVDEANDVLTTTEGIYRVNGGLLYKDFGLAGQQILLGDYAAEEFGMQVTDLQLVDNFPGTNTVSITLSIGLTQTVIDNSGATRTNTVDTLTFRTQTYPRNRS